MDLHLHRVHFLVVFSFELHFKFKQYCISHRFCGQYVGLPTTPDLQFNFPLHGITQPFCEYHIILRGYRRVGVQTNSREYVPENGISDIMIIL